MRISHHIPLQHKTFRRPLIASHSWWLPASCPWLPLQPYFAWTLLPFHFVVSNPTLLLSLCHAFPSASQPSLRVFSSHATPTLHVTNSPAFFRQVISASVTASPRSHWLNTSLNDVLSLYTPVEIACFLSGMGKIFYIVLVWVVFCSISLLHQTHYDKDWETIFVSSNFCFLFTLFCSYPPWSPKPERQWWRAHSSCSVEICLINKWMNG